jgi:hypothetical protein
MKVLELFCGTKSFSKVAENRGHDVFTIDIDPRYNPDMVGNLHDLNINDIPPEYQTPDVVWASPPCQCFSIMVVSKNWVKNNDGTYTSKRPETIYAMEIVQNTLKLINDLLPRYYFIENPRAMLRKMPFMADVPRSTVTYCKYGSPYQKATDIWNNCSNWSPKPICSKGDPCRVRSPGGSNTGIQGVKSVTNTGHYDFQFTPSGYNHRISQHSGDMGNESHRSAVARAIVPPALCEEIIIACEEGMK